MPWGRIDDTLYDHPKLDLLPDEHVWPDRAAVVGLNYLAVSWCNRFLTDGRLPATRVEKLGCPLELADLAVDVGLWEVAPGGYQIHDFLVYNDSREQVLERRRKEAERKAAYRAAKRPTGTEDGTPAGTLSVEAPSVPRSVPHGVPAGRDDVSRVVSRRVSRDSSRANPDPTRPDPSRPSDSPQPPASGGHGSRANGTTPRQIRAAAQAESETEQRRRADGRQKVELAYYRGELTEAQKNDALRELGYTVDDPATWFDAPAPAEAPA